MRFTSVLLTFLLLTCTVSAQPKPSTYDVLIKNGTIYDGTGAAPIKADIAIKGDRIVAIGDLKNATARTLIDARRLAVAPGFINMLSWASTSLIADYRSLSELRQGVTTEVFGEGTSMGPLNAEMKKRMLTGQGDFKFDIPWNSLAEYLTYMEKRGVTPNVASFIGAGTVRTYVIALEDKKATPDQLQQMREVVRREMEAGALGIGSSLIYAPDTYASTEELIEMCKEAAKYQGKYISHMRNEGDALTEAVEELLRISREANIPAEIYHLKASIERNWNKMNRVIAMVNAARGSGLKITADMYVYTASSNSIDSRIPAWAHSGGDEAMYKRLEDPAARKNISDELHQRGPMARTVLVGLRPAKLNPLIGKTLTEVAAARGKDEIETMLDLVLEARSRIQVVTFTMSEDNIKKELREPWVSFGSDASSMAAEGMFLESSTHPRAYGNFARVLGKYVREEKVITLQEAVRKLSGLPATNLGLDHRGFIKEGYFADVVVFDPNTIADKATYDKPHQYAVGMKHVFVNGIQVLKDGEHTGAKAGRALWGRGKIR
ncbi:MAG: N-acyl-D-amino-acid deacylase [Blastocatellia bacterium]|jgi:N-acyl-D-amino-acid deacylase|nr:N-acyl-D-amino-acid deacylase [Blastocatellia bacterium]